MECSVDQDLIFNEGLYRQRPSVVRPSMDVCTTHMLIWGTFFMDATVFNSYLEALIHHLKLVHNGDDVVVFSFSDDERLTPLLSPVTCCSIFQKRRIVHESRRINHTATIPFEKAR
jgi:hypothetical protein